jgi:hypothetical protein
VGQRSFCVHVHGVAHVVEPPERLSIRRMQSMIVGAAIAAVSMAGCHPSASSAAAASAATATANPPALSTGGAASAAVAATGGASDALASNSTSGQGGTEAVQSTTKAAVKRTRPIEVRQHPPKPMITPDPLK